MSNRGVVDKYNGKSGVKEVKAPNSTLRTGCMSSKTMQADMNVDVLSVSSQGQAGTNHAVMKYVESTPVGHPWTMHLLWYNQYNLQTV